MSSFFKGLRVWAAPIISSDITIFSCANSYAVCVLALKFGKTKTGDSHYKQKR
ncbi:hypothetical protein [Ruminococcus bromii]|uniref:hypothetical protein n=1 Tax=Ruminococcus bromii TaxID=40518 RepID=UPI002017D9E5|nr:hypothetical protein [Ruminococcus bromii]